jgi:glycosyltransferase involved in cell wall biosynthesis
MTPRFSIVTPSFRQLDWLKLCSASIADQAGVSIEHIVQDAGSGEAMQAWGEAWPAEVATRRDSANAPFSFRLVMEKDEGMYDAVNRGLRRATGEILAYLNCDEQYFPGALAQVDRFFRENPSVDVLFGDVVVVDAKGGYLCSRPVIRPTFYHAQICTLGVFTAATFFRRRLIEEQGLFFDPAWRDNGDSAWVLELLRRKVSTAVLRQFVTAFTDTGDNMNTRPNAIAEQVRLREMAPRWAQRLAPLWVLQHRLRRLLAGVYFPRKLNYAVYTLEHPTARQTFRVEKPTFVWAGRF